MIYPHNRILFIDEKEHTTDIKPTAGYTCKTLCWVKETKHERPIFYYSTYEYPTCE